MSDEMKNCCPPETTAPKMEVHDASEGSKDIKPKMISTAHKQLSKDEFQRKVAMVALANAADDMGLNTMEKEAILGAAFGLGRAALRGGLPLFNRAIQYALPAAGGAKTWSNLLPRALNAAGNSKLLSPLTAGAGQAKSWLNLPTRMLFGEKGLGSAALLPFTHAGYGAVTAAPLVAAGLPYVGGALQRAGQALGGTVGGGGSQGGLPNGLLNGGLLGAGIGAVGGALMPGQEEYEDEDGRIRKRSRGMFAGALRGAGMGGLAGGALGAGMEHFGPKMASAQDFGAAIANLQKQAMDPAQLKALMHGSPRGSLTSQLPTATARRPATPATSPAIQKGLLAGVGSPGSMMRAISGR